MKKLVVVFTLLFVSISALQLFGAEKSAALMPYPAQVTFTSDRFVLNENFSVEIHGTPDARLYPAVTRMMYRFVGRTGLFLNTDFLSLKTPAENAPLTITVDRPGKVVLNEDESYRLDITGQHIFLKAVTDLGALHGLETLLQVLDSDSSGYFFKGCSIIDAPKFPWRGLMLDVSRHFLPMDVIKRNIDGMAAVKLNILHLHLSEDQGFRVECKTFPKLHELGSDGLYYTQVQIKEILAYANARGIRVIPEFDLPSHCTSWFVGYPELASQPGPYTIERHWGVFNPTIDPTKETTYAFLDAFFKEMSQLFTDEYFHIGGDENTGKQWDDNPSIQKFKRDNKIADNHALQDYFINRVSKIFTKYNKKIVGWEEVMRQSSSTGTIVQTWREDKVLEDAVHKGYRVIVSKGYYIDLMYSAENHYSNLVIPNDLKLTEAEKKNILGAETTMWAEFVTPENIDSRIWPRTAAIAERFWSSEKVNDVRSMYARLETISFQFEELGLTHKKNAEMMLRRLTNNTDVTALRNFVAVIEPLKEYNRFDKGKDFASYSPYTRVMDVATADAPAARIFQTLVNDFSVSKKTDSKMLDSMQSYLQLWKTNHASLVRTIRVSPILKEIESLSADLSTVSEIGLQAVDAIRTKKKLDAMWVVVSARMLQKAKEQRGQCELMVVAPIEQLLAIARQQ
ncbi:MAG: beta-N-acetylhexosaminidase [Bacteroidota bacterium]|nr:beta-N-acetylhexosaminidase [Bacteroidota bacterium]